MPKTSRAAPKPAPKPSAKKGAAKVKAPAKAKAKASPKPPPPEPAAPPKPKAPATPAYVRHMAADVLRVNRMEHAGEHGRNQARFKRGELMIELRDTARQNGEKQKALLEEVNAHALELAERSGVLGFEPISPQEASITRRVVEAFGSGGDFPLVDAINKLTGEPLVDDDGQPLRVPLTEVAVSKLHALASIDPEYIDEAVSFAYRYSEKVVRKARKVAKDSEAPLQEIIRRVNAARVQAPHPVTGEPIPVQPENVDAYKLLTELAGEPPESEVVSIKTTRALYDGFYVPLKKLMSAVASRYQPQLVTHSSDGLVSNAFVLEQTVVQFFNVFEDEGVQRALAAMVASELITSKQADEFVDSYAFDPVTDEWKQVRDLPAQVDAIAAALDDDDDDDWDDEDEDDEDWGEDEEDEEG